MPRVICRTEPPAATDDGRTARRDEADDLRICVLVPLPLRIRVSCPLLSTTFVPEWYGSSSVAGFLLEILEMEPQTHGQVLGAAIRVAHQTIGAGAVVESYDKLL